MNRKALSILSLLLLLLGQMTVADWGEAVYELTTADDTSAMLEEDAMVFVLYEDRSHPDSSNMLKAFEQIAAQYLEHSISPL